MNFKIMSVRKNVCFCSRFSWWLGIKLSPQWEQSIVFLTQIQSFSITYFICDCRQLSSIHIPKKHTAFGVQSDSGYLAKFFRLHIRTLP